MQIPVGLGTPSHVVDVVTRRVDEHLSANRLEFSGDRIIVFKEITDTMPIRMQILIAVQLTHTGATAFNPGSCNTRIANDHIVNVLDMHLNMQHHS